MRRVGDALCILVEKFANKYMQKVLTLRIERAALLTSLAGRFRKSDLLRLELRIGNAWLLRQRKLPQDSFGSPDDLSN